MRCIFTSSSGSSGNTGDSKPTSATAAAATAAAATSPLLHQSLLPMLPLSMQTMLDF